MKAIIRDLSVAYEARSMEEKEIKELRIKVDGVTRLVIKKDPSDGNTYIRYWSNDSELEIQ